MGEIENGKAAAGEAAAKLVQDGMLVGLGTGSTAAFLILSLGQRCTKENLQIKAVATSIASEKLARMVGIPLIDPNDVELLDITLDGADEVDPHKNMIKGRGGALLREKILAQSSKEMVVIVDASKMVKELGKCPVPLEIAQFGFGTTCLRLKELGYHGSLRCNQDGTLYRTDNQNYIVDLVFDKPILDPAGLHQKLKVITGVIETGLFFKVAGRVIIGHENGKIEIRQ